MKTVAYLIGTEHQLMQVLASLDYFNIDRSEAVLLVEEFDAAYPLTEKIKSYYGFTQVYGFQNWTFKDLILGRTKKVKTFLSLLDEQLGTGNNNLRFFASHYTDDSTLLVLARVKMKEFYLMDEGTASFAVVCSRATSEFKKKWITRVKSLFYRDQIRIPQSINYFTRFELNVDSKDQRTLYVPEKQKKEIVRFNEGEVDFLGSSIVELDMIEEADYLVFLKKVAQMYKGKKLNYFNHRKESKEKLRNIEAFGFEVKETGTTYENYFTTNMIPSKVVCSFFTTSVLMNLGTNFSEVPELVVYEFPLGYLKKEREIYRLILEVLKKDDSLKVLEL